MNKESKSEWITVTVSGRIQNKWQKTGHRIINKVRDTQTKGGMMMLLQKRHKQKKRQCCPVVKQGADRLLI